MPYFANDNKFIAVSADFIKNDLPAANPTFVKIYLYLLMLASENTHKDFSEIAETLGLLESDLMLGIKYWEENGAITKSGECFSFSRSGAKPQEPARTYNVSKTAGINVAEIIEADSVLSDMFRMVQEILAKTISKQDMEMIYWFYSELNMQPEVILMLLEHCVSKGKNRMPYIEKVAINWSEMGLTTPEKVLDYIKSEEEKTGFLYSIRKIMGIADRSLSQIEEKYLTKWHDEMGMSEEMIALSYEFCIIQTAKLSFPYMDKIIVRWSKQGINTIEAAEEDNRRFKNRKNKEGTAFSDSSYDHDDLEKLTRK